MSTLYVVSTPIGNMQDITLRALEVLKKVDLILAEDTRQTGKLLAKYDINKPMESFFEHKEERKIDSIISRLKTGTEIALVSDAGTPLISDPGFKLVREAVRENIKITPIPGPSAVITALTASGLPTDQFMFLGYFPKKASKQDETLNFLKELWGKRPVTIVFYDAPYRVRKTLGIINKVFPKINVVLAREMTKIHEEFVRGKIADIIKVGVKTKGELALLLWP